MGISAIIPAQITNHALQRHAVCALIDGIDGLLRPSFSLKPNTVIVKNQNRASQPNYQRWQVWIKSYVY